MRAEVAQAVDAAGLLRVAAPFALLAAPFAFVRKPALRILRLNGADLAELALRDKSADVLRGHVSHIGVGHEEEQPLLVGELRELFRLGNFEAERLVARDVDARFQEGFADRIVADVRRDDDDEINAVRARRLRLRHLVKAGVAAVGSDAELRAGLAAFFRRAGEAAGNQFRHSVNIDGLSVGVADKGTGTAADHAVGEFLHVNTPLL